MRIAQDQGRRGGVLTWVTQKSSSSNLMYSLCFIVFFKQKYDINHLDHAGCPVDFLFVFVLIK